MTSPATPAFTVDPASLTYVGTGLHRPECVLCTASGELYVSHWESGVSRIAPDGTVSHCLPAPKANPGGKSGPVRPNGIALRADGSFLLANLIEGGVFRLRPDGGLRPELLEVDGQPLPVTNYVMIDAQGRMWVTVSTRREPRSLGYRPDVDDGFVVLRDARGARIVADGLGFTNECVLAPDGQWLYVNETYTRRLSRFAVAANGDLGPRETVATFGHGVWPDGLAFDAEGALWLTSVVSNRILRVMPDGTVHLVLEDNDPAHTERVEAAYLAGELSRELMDSIPTRYLKSCSSLAFGGPDLRTVYLGALLDDRLACFRSPVAGHPPVHWRWRSAF